MAVSVAIHSTDAASGQKRTITLVKTGPNTLAAFYGTSADTDVKRFDLSHVKADPDQGTIGVTYGSFPFSVSATGQISRDPPFVFADAGLFGKHQFPLQSDDYDRIIAFLRQANFPTA